MSKIRTKNILLQDKTYLQVNIYLSYPLKSNRVSMQFIDGSEELEIISSSFGSIRNNQITANKPNAFIQIVLNYRSSFNFLASFFLDDQFIDSELISVNSDPVDDSNKIEFQTDASKTFWKTFLYKNNNGGLLIRVMKSGKNCYLCIGEKSDYLNASDHVFKIVSGVKKVDIPKEITQKYIGKNVSCFEIVRKHDSSNKNLYKKIEISNSISME